MKTTPTTPHFGEIMDQAILAAADAIRAVLPKGSSMSLIIDPDYINVTLHTCAAWLRDQGAVVGPWYGFDSGREGRCQRNLTITVGDMKITGCETSSEAGITIGEARLDNEAAKAALAA
jgi:hypothetical protein